MSWLCTYFTGTLQGETRFGQTNYIQLLHTILRVAIPALPAGLILRGPSSNTAPCSVVQLCSHPPTRPLDSRTVISLGSFTLSKRRWAAASPEIPPPSIANLQPDNFFTAAAMLEKARSLELLYICAGHVNRGRVRGINFWSKSKSWKIMCSLQNLFTGYLWTKESVSFFKHALWWPIDINSDMVSLSGEQGQGVSRDMLNSVCLATGSGKTDSLCSIIQHMKVKNVLLHPSCASSFDLLGIQ